MTELASIKKEFPIFRHPDFAEKPLVYLDSAATTQKPHQVIRSITDFYTGYNSNVHRGIYTISRLATDRYQAVRGKMQRWINANSENELVFTKGATEGINLVANSFLRERLHPGDEVIVSGMEHHANLVPWQVLCREKQAILRIIRLDEKGVLDLDHCESLLSDRTRLLAVSHISNTLGTVNPIGTITSMAQRRNVPVLIDAAQSMASSPPDVQQIGCDFLVCSAHKMFGPTGTGVLYGKAEHLQSMKPYQYGGDMIRSVSYQEASFAEVPRRFEGGTPNIAGVIGLGAALDFLHTLDRTEIKARQKSLLDDATRKLQQLDNIRIIGEAEEKSSILSFVLPDIHPHDIATFLDEDNICIRAGHHCTQPLMTFFGVPATVRASFSIYNDLKDIDLLINGLEKILVFFGKK